MKADLIGEGEILKQPELADTLEQLVREGDRLFYEGEIAESIVSKFEGKGGHLTEERFRDIVLYVEIR